MTSVERSVGRTDCLLRKVFWQFLIFTASSVFLRWSNCFPISCGEFSPWLEARWISCLHSTWSRLACTMGTEPIRRWRSYGTLWDSFRCYSISTCFHVTLRCAPFRLHDFKEWFSVKRFASNLARIRFNSENGKWNNIKQLTVFLKTKIKLILQNSIGLRSAPEHCIEMIILFISVRDLMTVSMSLFVTYAESHITK